MGVNNKINKKQLKKNRKQKCVILNQTITKKLNYNSFNWLVHMLDAGR